MVMKNFGRQTKSIMGVVEVANWMFKWLVEIAKKGLYYINTNKIPGELSCKKRLSSHMFIVAIVT